MNIDVTQLSFYKELYSQIQSWLNEYPIVTKEEEEPSQQIDVIK